MQKGASLLLHVLLQCVGAAVASQCWQGATFSEAVVSPALRSSSILRVPDVASLAQCAGACCDLQGCDLAWLFERRCYVLSCQPRENCQPRQRPGADSYLAFLQRGTPQTLVLQSLVRGEPYPSRWKPLHRPSGDVEALKDLALFDGASPDFGDPGVMDLEYAESELGPKDKSGVADVLAGSQADLFPDWPAALEAQDGFNLSESEGGAESEPTENSLPKFNASTGAAINQGTHAIDQNPTMESTAANKTDSELQNVSSVSSEPTLQPQRENSSADSSQQSQIRTSPPTEASPLRSNTMPLTTPTQTVRALLVSIGDPIVLTLPLDTVELEASVDPEPQTVSPYRYEWSLCRSPGGHKKAIEGEHKKSVQLPKLSAGHYTVTMAVTGEGSYGEGTVNITVREAARENQPPKAVALPVIQVMSFPDSDVIVNGSQSTDDTMVISYHWDQVRGLPVELGASSDTQILNLSSLNLGEYTFRLTVEDSDGLSDSTTATVRVIQPKESDPSSDRDHDISTASATPGPAVTALIRQDVPTTATSPVPSSATATLKPEEGGTSVAEVKGSNQAPVAVVGPDRQLTLPVASVTLDGSSSTDDNAIVSYHWDTISGPPGSRIEGVDKDVAMVTGLRAGRYTFRLTVNDQEGAADSSLLTVRVQEAKNFPPVAHASGSHTLTLPNNSLVLQGSVTDGDLAEVHFLWVRDSQSPAAGELFTGRNSPLLSLIQDVLYSSEHQASLYLANLVEGTYLFQLRVTDAQGRTSAATATVEVRPDPGGREEVEVEMLVAVAQVSVAQRDTVLRQLAALLHVLDNDIHLRGLRGHSDLSTVLRFSVQGPEGPVPGPKLAGLLRGQLLREKTDYLLFRVLRVDTVMCLLRCSGHGQCDPITKECVCDPFWTENLIRRFFGDGESNCEWRVLYAILSSFMAFVLIGIVTWACVCCCKRRRRTKVRKKTKYTILDNMDEQERMELRPKYNIKHRSTEHNSSLMMSESELDSDQDTIFSRDRPVRSRNRTNTQAARNGNAFG